MGLRDRLTAYARFLAGPQESDDLLQSTLENLIRTREKYVEGNLVGWATHMMYNTWVDLRTYKTRVAGQFARKPRPVFDYLDQADHETKPGTGASPEDTAYCREVCRVMEGLSDDDVTLLTLTGEGYRPVEIAALQGHTDYIGVSKRLYKARARLTARLK
jgi:DNA-directed RNA polymerase specialized sigma24 family protein